MKYIVIGSNHAGTAAINTLLSNKKEEDSVVVYDRNSNISFLGCGMALWIGGQIPSGEELFYSNAETLEAAGAKIHMEAEVTDIDFENKKVHVTLKDGSKIEDNYDKLILATGSVPFVPPIEGLELENIKRVKLYQDAQDVIKTLETEDIKKVAVVGAGYIGVELAEAFIRHGKEVYLIDIMNSVLGPYYDNPFRERMAENMEKHGVKLALEQSVEKFEGDKKVEKVITNKGEYEADLVCLCIGFRPNNVLGKEKLDLFKNGAYIVDKFQRTSEKDVFAVGDCATIYDNSIDDINYIALATNAVRSGIVGALNALGIETEHPGVQGSNGICIFDYKLVSTGLTIEKAKRFGIEVEFTDYEDYQLPKFMRDHNEKVKIRIVYRKDNRQVVGAQMGSFHDMSMGLHMFSLAIQEKVTIDKLKLLDIFFLPHLNQPYNYITMAALSAK